MVIAIDKLKDQLNPIKIAPANPAWRSPKRLNPQRDPVSIYDWRYTKCFGRIYKAQSYNIKKKDYMGHSTYKMPNNKYCNDKC
jgi:hypothetical protein